MIQFNFRTYFRNIKVIQKQKYSFLNKINNFDSMCGRISFIFNQNYAVFEFFYDIPSLMLHNGNKFSMNSYLKRSEPRTGKSFSEALILASTNPQYDKRLFMELPLKLQGQNMFAYLLSYCGLIDAKIRASGKDLPVLLVSS